MGERGLGQGPREGLMKMRLLLLAGALSISTPAFAQSASIHNVAIPSQSLADSLFEVSRLTGVQVIFTDPELRTRRAPRVSGALTTEQILTRLLQGTNYTFRFTSANAVRIVKREHRAGSVGAERAEAGSAGLMQNQAATDAEEDEAPEIVVTARVAKLYRVRKTTTGKLPSDPLASSQSITVISEDLIRDQGARDAQDLYRNISGVSFFSYAGVTARGFRQEEVFYDGLRGEPYVGFSVPQLFNIERVEFLKGPAGMLYGPGAPGGLFNYVTKKPEFTEAGRVAVVVGTENRYGGQAEWTGPVAGDFAGRLGVFYENRDAQRVHANAEVLIVDAGAAADLGFGTLTLQGTRYAQNLDGQRLRGVPVDDEGNFLASRRWNHNEPDDFLNMRSNVLQARIEGSPIDSLTVDATLRYNDAVESQRYHEPFGLFDSNGDGIIDSSRRQFRDHYRTQETWSFGANAIWSARLGGISNRLLAGHDYFFGDNLWDQQQLAGGTVSRAGLPSPLSLLNPVYGQSDSRTYNMPPVTRRLTKRFRRGFYLLDEITLGRLVLTGGLRHDGFKDVQNGREFNDERLTYRIGAVYRLRDDVSLFAQHATSFEPQAISAQDPRAGGPFPPTTGDIIEGGIKTALMNGRLQTSLAAYRIRRANILQPDPRGDVADDGVDDFVAFGEVTSKGIDFDLATDLTPDWVLTLAYAYNDTRVTADNAGGGLPNRVGDQFVNAPRNKLGFWTRYQFPVSGLAVAFGGDYVSSRRSINNQLVKSYFVFDASVFYEKGPWSAQIRVDNLFDKTYATSGFFRRTGHFVGRPRSVFLQLSRRF